MLLFICSSVFPEYALSPVLWNIEILRFVAIHYIHGCSVTFAVWNSILLWTCGSSCFCLSHTYFCVTLISRRRTNEWSHLFILPLSTNVVGRDNNLLSPLADRQLVYSSNRSFSCPGKNGAVYTSISFFFHYKVEIWSGIGVCIMVVVSFSLIEWIVNVGKISIKVLWVSKARSGCLFRLNTVTYN